jgi:hypothetical protein
MPTVQFEEINKGLDSDRCGFANDLGYHAFGLKTSFI